MKRSSSSSSSLSIPMDSNPEENNKKKKIEIEEEEEVMVSDLGEDLVLEVLKRADARTVARAACVSRRWRKMADDERLWEEVCTKQWASIGCGAHQLRSVVLTLGGFKRLHSAYLQPLLQPSSRPRRGVFPSSSSASSAAAGSSSRWGKDEVQLSLSLLSVGYFMTNCNNK